MTDLKDQLIQLGTTYPEMQKNLRPILDVVTAARLRKRDVNRKIRQRGIDAELVRGQGYYYFVGPDVEGASSTSVMVFALNHLSLEQWMSELDAIIEDANR